MTVNVKQYIAGAPAGKRPLLRDLDAQVKEAFPSATLDPKSAQRYAAGNGGFVEPT